MNNKIIHKFLFYLSKFIPDSNIKKHLRVIFYNFKDRKSDVKYTFQQKFYTAELDSIKLKFIEEPFGIHKLMDEYDKYHMVKPGDVVVDAGAFIGQYSIWAATKIGDQGKLISIEPDKNSYEKLFLNISLNNLRNIETSNKLLWDDEGIVPFSQMGTVGSSAIWKPDDHFVIDKETVSLDKLIGCLHLSNVNFIKMDIEGAEIKALDGCKWIMTKFHPKFAIASYHQINGVPTRDEVERKLRAFNYSVETLFYGRECITYAW